MNKKDKIALIACFLAIAEGVDGNYPSITDLVQQAITLKHEIDRQLEKDKL